MRQFTRRERRGNALSVVADNSANDAIIRERINRSMRRRMSDDLVSLIRRACLCGHAETAKGLWVVLRDLTRREAQQRYPHGRLPDDSLIDALAVEIAAAARGEQSNP
jgi:hypothetical protein